MDLRCTSKKHAVIPEDGLVEIKCDSRFCGAKQGNIVLHTFDAHTGELIKTSEYRNPDRKV